MNETRIVVCLCVIILWICKGDACSSPWVSSGTNCYYISEDSRSMDEAQAWCQTRDATLLIHLDELPDADRDAIQDHMTSDDPYWIGIKKSDGTYLWADGTEFDRDMFEDGGGGWCATLTRGQSLLLIKTKCNIEGSPAKTKFICQRANCENSKGWYSLFNTCVWVSTKQTSTYTSCEEIGGRLLRWQLLDAGKKYLLSPPLVVDQLYWYTVNDDACCCTWRWWNCCMRSIYRHVSYGWWDGYCGFKERQFICQSDPASVHRSTTTAHPREVTSTLSQFSTPAMRSTEHVSLNTDATTSSGERNATEGGSSAPRVSGASSVVVYGAGGGVAALVVLVAVAAVVGVILYRRRRLRKDVLSEPSSAAAFHNAAYVDPATVIHSEPRQGSDQGRGAYSLATRPLPAQSIGAASGGGDGNTYDNINDSLFNGNSVASNGNVASSSSAGTVKVDNAVYSTVNKDKSKGQGSPGLNGCDARGGGKEHNVVYSSVDKDKAKKGHDRNTSKSADKSFYRPDSTEMVMSENTEYVSGDDSGISTSETDYSEIKGSGRNMEQLTHKNADTRNNTRPDSTELLMSENTLYGDGSRNDGNDPADTDYYNVRGTENNLDSQTNQPAAKSADRPDENQYYNVMDFQSHNANSDIGPRCRQSYGLTLEENDVYCSGN